ncbi:MAG: rRNA pseudouridine synthase, partial [Oscillospiraceae bacterium]|nr:rRNA pseudouridine synthase [Oscillospiraceae bacterium]
GRVCVNGEKAQLGDKADPALDRITVDGKELPREGEKLYLMLHKPRGYVTTLRDEKGRKNVTELMTGLETRVYPVGRLDMYSEGLLFMTNDGDFANRVMHPAHEVEKVYHTWVTGENIEKSVHMLRRPMEIDGVRVCAKGVDIVQGFPGGALLSVTIAEGRNRQVRKMCDQAGLKVTRLMRVEEGGVALGDLRSGCWRRLRPEEINRLLGKGKK